MIAVSLTEICELYQPYVQIPNPELGTVTHKKVLYDTLVLYHSVMMTVVPLHGSTNKWANLPSHPIIKPAALLLHLVNSGAIPCNYDSLSVVTDCKLL